MDETLEKVEMKPKKNSRLCTAVPLYSVEKILKHTRSLGRWGAREQTLHSDHVTSGSQNGKSLPFIMSKMNRSKKLMEDTMYKNHSKLNSSFSGYFRNEINLVRDELKKKKITKLKKAEEKGKKMIETPPIDRDEGGFMDLNFKMSPLLNRCFDSLFPAIRYSPTLFSNDKSVYLLGGYHMQGSEGMSLFHRYDMQERKWVQVRGQGQSPKLSPCFHTVQVYRGNMLITGGVSFQGQKGKRFNTDLLIFNLQRSEWLRARGGVSLKHHASTIFGSTLMISGGINQKEKFSEDLYFITFTGGNLLNPLIFGVKNQTEFGDKVAHHKLLNTYELEPNLRNQVKMEGVFSFGGEDQKGILNNNLMFINVLGKVGQNLDIKFKKWELVQTNDDRPCPRKDHSFNMISKKGIAVLAGGIEQNGNWLTDIWIFDFVRNLWGRVTTDPCVEESIGSLAGHCGCSLGSGVYLYNGNVQKKRERGFWLLQTQQTLFKSKKTIYSTKLPSFKSIRSDKQNFSLNRI